MGKVDFSVAICTYNRAEQLDRAITRMSGLTIPDTANWELLVIDNNSTDRTCKIIHSFQEKLPIRYLFEVNQGLSWARNRAISEFRGDFLIFSDDDVLVDPGWLEGYTSAFRGYPNIGYYGGLIRPYWDGQRPSWLVDESLPLIAGLLVHYNLGNFDRLIEEMDMHPYGANFALSRNTIEKTGLFRTDLGVKGKVPGRGEDAEYIGRARKAGSQGMYVANARCHHTVDPKRLTLEYLYRYGIEKGLANLRIEKPESVPSLFQYLNFALRGLWQLAKGRGDRFRQCVINMGIIRGLRQS